MLPRFVQIKKALLDSIDSGRMRPGDQVASENQLALEHGVSRMTARKALSELVQEGILMRSQGIGTFVCDHRPMSSMLTITPIDQEVKLRGHQYTNQVLCVEAIAASEQQAAWLGVAAHSRIFHSCLIHFENHRPIQFEERLVNPRWAPDYLLQDFHQTSANQYLNQVAPLTEADHIVEAILAPKEIQHHLKLDEQHPCLLISRRTFSAKGIVSFVQLYHPGDRYRIGGHLDF